MRSVQILAAIRCLLMMTAYADGTTYETFINEEGNDRCLHL